MTELGSFKTDPELLRLLERAKLHVMTPDEIFEQRVSWCYGMQDCSAGNMLSKDQVREILLRQAGQSTEGSG